MNDGKRCAVNRMGGIAIMLAAVMMFAGCSGSRFWRTGDQTGNSQGKTGKEPAPAYYDFGDVLIPNELKLDRKASFVFQTPNMTAGVLALSGRVETASLIRFFETNMSKDNWQPVSSFKSVRTIMLFRKDNRWCVINVSESNFTTRVEVWVAPTSHTGDGSGLLKQGQDLQ